MDKDMDAKQNLIMSGPQENYQSEIAFHSLFEQLTPIEPLPQLTEEQQELIKHCRTFRKYQVSQAFVHPDLPKDESDEMFSLVPEEDAQAFVNQLKKTSRRYLDTTN